MSDLYPLITCRMALTADQIEIVDPAASLRSQTRRVLLLRQLGGTGSPAQVLALAESR
ncbi:MAG: hypothetical protein L0H41_13525 [Microlunatus sp.]|nr:hypothetical protein [Microlunatus sp.]